MYARKKSTDLVLISLRMIRVIMDLIDIQLTVMVQQQAQEEGRVREEISASMKSTRRDARARKSVGA